MKQTLLAITIGFSVMAGASARADEIATFANAKCSGCHGEAGNNDDSFFPRLAGQQRDYIVARIKAFSDFERVDLHARFFMEKTAISLSDVQVNALASYYAAASPTRAPAGDPALVKRGEKIFQQGAMSRKLPTCANCHGQDAAGKGTTPRLAGQHARYLERQLAVFKVGVRRSDVAHIDLQNLTADDIVALAAYLEQR